MATGFVPIDHYKTKLYQREKDSKRFLDMSEEQLTEISKKVYRRQEIMDEMLPHGRRSSFQKLERYYMTLKYLISPNIHLEYKTFDEKIAFLIMMTDPNLTTYREFLKTDLVSFEEINASEDKKEKAELTMSRARAISDFETRVREQLGFYDAKLLKYEEAFFKRFLSDKELVTAVSKRGQNDLMARSRLLSDFNGISDKRYLELCDIAQGWLTMVPEKKNSSVATYSVMNQRKLLGINTLSEQLALFVLMVDSNLDMLRIYEEESRMPIVEERIIEEFGYFSTDLLALERKFHNRFCPNKKLSVWTKIKKN